MATVGDLAENQDLQVLRSRRQKPEQSFLEAFFVKRSKHRQGTFQPELQTVYWGGGGVATKGGLSQDACSTRPLVPGWAETEGSESSQSVLDGPLQGQASVL